MTLPPALQTGIDELVRRLGESEARAAELARRLGVIESAEAEAVRTDPAARLWTATGCSISVGSAMVFHRRSFAR